MIGSIQVNDTIDAVDKMLDKLTKSLPHEFVGLLKQRFQSVIQNILKLNFADIRVDFVVDTNTIINSLLRYVDGKSSILFNLVNNQIFKFHAPAHLEYEVAKFINTPKKGRIKNKLIQAWLKLKKVLKLGTQLTINALNLANMIIGPRDPKDVPFVAMYIDLGASNILTFDKDFENQLLKPLRIDKVGQMVAAVYRGLLCFFVLNDLTPATLEFFVKMVLELIRTLFDALKLLLDFLSAAARNATEEATNLISNFFPEMKDWIDSGGIKAALFAIAIIVGGVVIIDEGIRNNLIRLTNLIIKSLEPAIDRFVNWVENSIRTLIDCAKILLPHIIAVLLTLLTNISRVVNHVKVYPSQFAG